MCVCVCVCVGGGWVGGAGWFEHAHIRALKPLRGVSQMVHRLNRELMFTPRYVTHICRRANGAGVSQMLHRAAAASAAREA